MNQKHYLSQAAVAMTLMLCLAGCGTDKDMGSTAPSASVSPSPAVTEDTGSTMTPDSSREDRDSGVEDSAVDRPPIRLPIRLRPLRTPRHRRVTLRPVRT